MRIAIVGPFTGALLSARFDFSPPGQTLPPGYPGAPLMTVLARSLVERGHQVAAITTDYAPQDDSPAPFRVFRAPGLTAYFCPQRPRSFRGSGGRPGRALDFFADERRRLKAALEDFRPDIVHAHWTYEFAWAALDSGYPTLTTAHDSPWKVLRFTPELYRAFRYAMARRVIPRCRHLTAVSPDLEADIERYTKAPVHVVPNPISADVMDAPGCDPQAHESQRLLMVLNGWNNLKNGATALQAFAVARQANPRLRLVCFGASWEHGGVAHHWAARRGLDAGVEFRGPVAHSVVLEQMQSSAALLHPSRWEACCMAIAEAMSLGLPVIAGRRTDGVAWQLDQGRAGMLVDVTDARDIARGIAAVAGDFARWRATSQAARARAREMFSVDRVTDQYLSHYAHVLGGPAPAAGV